MKLFSALLLTLSLLSTAALAETTLFGLTLGQSTLNEVKQLYTLTSQRTASSTPDSWLFYRISGKQLNDPKLKHATLYFDDEQVLGRVWLFFPSSEPTFNQLDQHLLQQYPLAATPAFEPDEFQLRQTDYQNDKTHVRLMYSLYSTNVTYADLDYRKAVKHAIVKKKATNASQSVAKKPIRKPPHDDDQ